MTVQKRVLVVLLCMTLAAAIVFSGCGAGGPAKVPEKEAENTAVQPETSQQTSVNAADMKGSVVHYTINSEDKAYIKALIPDFNKIYPGIKVETLESPYKEFDTKLQTLVASGSPPDVTSHYGNLGYIEFLDKDIIIPLDELMTKHNFNPVEMGIPEELMGIYKSDGKVYGIPSAMYVSLMAYNKDMFDKAGVPYPTTDGDDRSWTFEKMVEIAKKLTVVSDNIAKVQYGLDWDKYARIMNPSYFGAKVFSDDTWTNGGHPSEVYFDSPDFIKYTQRLNDLIYVDKVTPTPSVSTSLSGGGESGGNTGDAFAAGKIALQMGGAWIICGADQLSFRVGVAPIPFGGNDKARSTLYVDPLMILKGSKDPDAAIEWIKFMVTKDAQEKAVELSATPPANRNALDKYLNSTPGIDPKELKGAVDAGIKYGIESYNHLVVNYAEMDRIMENEYAPMENDRVPAEQVLKIAQEKITKIIKDSAK